MANGACLVAWRVQVGETGTLVFVRFLRMSLFFVVVVVNVVLVKLKGHQKRLSVIKTLFAKVCATHDRIYLKPFDRHDQVYTYLCKF